MEIYDKPFKTFDELVSVLRNKHSLYIEDDEFVKEVLQFVPYYDLVNGYKRILMDGEKFKNNVDIQYLFMFHSFDQEFQSVIFKSSVIIENYFKNILAYTIGQSYGVSTDKYLYRSNYLPRKFIGKKKFIQRKKILSEIKDIASTTIDNPTRYYRNNHNHIPPWILFKNISFSLSTNLLILLKRNEKKAVLDYMLPFDMSWDQKWPVLLYSLTMIRKCRNTIAHNLQFTSFNCAKYMNNLNKHCLRQLIPQCLLTDQEIDSNKYLDGIYGYIVLCLSIIPNDLTRLIMIQRLLHALTFDGILDDADLVSLKENIHHDYFYGLNIPTDFTQRLHAYQQFILKKHK